MFALGSLRKKLNFSAIKNFPRSCDFHFCFWFTQDVLDLNSKMKKFWNNFPEIKWYRFLGPETREKESETEQTVNLSGHFWVLFGQKSKVIEGHQMTI